jgi:hypothetical protein
MECFVSIRILPKKERQSEIEHKGFNKWLIERNKDKPVVEKKTINVETTTKKFVKRIISETKEVKDKPFEIINIKKEVIKTEEFDYSISEAEYNGRIVVSEKDFDDEIKYLEKRINEVENNNFDFKMKLNTITREHSRLLLQLHELELENRRLNQEIVRLKSIRPLIKSKSSNVVSSGDLGYDGTPKIVGPSIVQTTFHTEEDDDGPYGSIATVTTWNLLYVEDLPYILAGHVHGNFAQSLSNFVNENQREINERVVNMIKVKEESLYSDDDDDFDSDDGDDY